MFHNIYCLFEHIGDDEQYFVTRLFDQQKHCLAKSTVHVAKDNDVATIVQIESFQRNRGYGTLLLSLVLKYCFKRLQCSMIGGCVYPFDHRSVYPFDHETDREWLCRWYRKFQFAIDEWYDMAVYPRTVRYPIAFPDILVCDAFGPQHNGTIVVLNPCTMRTAFTFQITAENIHNDGRKLSIQLPATIPPTFRHRSCLTKVTEIAACYLLQPQ